MELTFWLSCAFVGYVYAGYPLLLAAWARLRPRPAAGKGTLQPRPEVSIVLAARNEGSRLPARLDNLLQLDFPADRRQIIVVSDGSTDETEARLAPYTRTSAVELISIRTGGKAQALNAGVARARFGLLVFADARQTFAPDALTELVRPFEDPEVGAVTGELVLDAESAGRRKTGDRRKQIESECRNGRSGRSIRLKPDATPDRVRLKPDTTLETDWRGERRSHADRRRTVESTIADGVGLYWRYEKSLRRLESIVGSTLGATGAIYAMRRSLWTPLPPDTLLDDVLAPMRCVLGGSRVLFNDRARAFDRTAPDAEAEARRKTRTLAGNYQILWLEPRLLLPWRNPVWLQYVSHKIGRLIVPYALLACFVASVALAARDPVYLVALTAQCLFYLLAGYGAWLDHRGSARIREARSRSRAGWSAAASSGHRGAANA